MKTKEMRRLNDTELQDELRAAQEELFNARFQLATRQLKNYRGLPVAKRRIARALTVIKQRETETSG